MSSYFFLISLDEKQTENARQKNILSALTFSSKGNIFQRIHFKGKSDAM